MFSRVAIAVNLFGLSFYLASYILKQNKSLFLPLHIILHSDVVYWGILSILIGIIICVLTCVYIGLMCLFVKVHTGKPPIGKMTIAYKFKLQDDIESSVLEDIRRVFPSLKTVHLCYSSLSSRSLGIAYGVILDEEGSNINDELKVHVQQNGYSIFQTPVIQHAVYITCPTLPWILPSVSLWLYWVVLSRMYPELYDYTEKHMLSAYPVIEVYRHFSLILMAPLSRQDDFVVKEAVEMIHRASVSMDFSTSSSMSMSHSMCSKTTSYSFQSPEGIIRSKESKQSSYSLG